MTRCPKCDAELEVQEADPDVGITSAGAYCDACDLVVDVEHEYYDDDVQLFGTDTGSVHDWKSPKGTSINSCCQHCLTQLECGYGLAGGGLGPYMYCPNERCGKTIIKSQDHTA